MKKRFILGLLILSAVSATAQERDRFNIGIHYKPPVANEIDDLAAGIDFRVRAVSLGVVNLGAGLSATYRKENVSDLSDFVIWNPQVYAEFQPFDFALKPYVAIGYAFYTQKIDIVDQGYYEFDPVFTTSDQKLNYGGVTGHLGARLDFAKILFADVGLGYYKFTSTGPRYYSIGDNGYAMIHLGFGFRF